MNQTQVGTSRERMFQVVLKRQQLAGCGTYLCSIAASMALALKFYTNPILLELPRAHWRPKIKCTFSSSGRNAGVPFCWQITPLVYDQYKLNNNWAEQGFSAWSSSAHQHQELPYTNPILLELPRAHWRPKIECTISISGRNAGVPLHLRYMINTN